MSVEEVCRLTGPLDLTGLSAIADLDRADLKYTAFVPATHRDLAEVESSHPPDVFTAIRQHEVLLHHPYDSFSTSVQRFVEQAAADPQVLAIKQTLYRTNEESPIVDALVDAAEAGIQVLVVVEIKARFDEEANIRWARQLEHSGCHVVYGLIGLKTHCKLSLVVRDEPDGIRRYAHIGTGNYNPKTARLYEDIGLLTSDPVLTADLSVLFNHLSGYALTTEYRRLLVAPRAIRTGLIERIRNEVAHHQAGRPARIRIKANSLVDEACIDALYEASRAGVPIDLWIRSICALKPGVPGLSETIRVRSILGRFLEHSRIYWFEAGGSPEVWTGSADLMHRNLDRRVEALIQITEPDHIDEVARVFDLAFDTGTAAWVLHADTWTQARTGAGGAAAPRSAGTVDHDQAPAALVARLRTSVETERKFGVDQAYVVPALGDLVEVVDDGTDTLATTYLDTADLRLWREGVVLRRRTGGPDAGWHLKFPDDGASKGGASKGGASKGGASKGGGSKGGGSKGGRCRRWRTRPPGGPGPAVGRGRRLPAGAVARAGTDPAGRRQCRSDRRATDGPGAPAAPRPRAGGIGRRTEGVRRRTERVRRRAGRVGRTRRRPGGRPPRRRTDRHLSRARVGAPGRRRRRPAPCSTQSPSA